MDTNTMFRPLADDELRKAQTATPAEAWTAIVPVPADAPQLTNGVLSRWAEPGYSVTTGWRYLDANGDFLGCVVRYDGPGDKIIAPITFCTGPNGARKWRKKSWTSPRPLYGLDRLAASPGAPVIVTEGEKAADAAEKLFPGYVAVTSPGGSNAAGNADWSVLKGRKLTVWPDHDEAGEKYAADVLRLASQAGAAVAVVSVPASFPHKWDLADQIPEGVTVDKLMEMLEQAEPSNGWQRPVPIASSLPAVEPFVPEMLPAALRAYVFDVADRQQSAPDFVAVAELCGIASLIGNHVRIAPKQNDDWIEVPNLWGAIIGPPSAMKSPAMQSALGPIYAIQDEMRNEWQSALADADIDDALSGLDAREAKKKAAKALKDGDRDTARTILADVSKGDGEGPPCPRIVVNDATVEKLGELLNENPRGLLLIRDELPGFLARMESEEYASERAFYLEAFNGSGRFTYDRIGRGTVHIANCTLSIIGGVQPSRIPPIVRGAVSGTSNDGLIPRLPLAVWPDNRKSWQWVDRSPDGWARDEYERAFRALHDLKLGTSDEPTVLRFSSAAQMMFREWMTDIQTEARSGKLSPVLESHLLKMPKTVASLALIFELIDGGRFEVGEQSTLMALAWAEYLRTHANRLYSSGNTMIEDGARLIIERRSQLPEEFTVRDIYKKDWAGLSDRDAAMMAVELLVTTHHCREIEKPESTGRGRPTATYRWNPALVEV